MSIIISWFNLLKVFMCMTIVSIMKCTMITVYVSFLAPHLSLSLNFSLWWTQAMQTQPYQPLPRHTAVLFITYCIMQHYTVNLNVHSRSWEKLKWRKKHNEYNEPQKCQQKPNFLFKWKADYLLLIFTLHQPEWHPTSAFCINLIISLSQL